MAKNNRSGFTALEMSVVVSMILILVGFVLPSVVSQQSSEKDRAFRVSVSRLPSQARVGAINDNKIYHLQMDGEQKIVIRKEDDNGQVSSSDPVATVNVPDGTTLSDFVQSGNHTNSASWDVRFYPDGTADPSGIAFSKGADVLYALNIDGKGTSSIDAALTDTTLTSWDAGSYEQH